MGAPSAPALGRSWARRLRCSRTGAAGPLERLAGLSPAGAPWLVEYALDPAAGAALRAALPGRPWSLWRYLELLPVENLQARVDLGEGGTPLVALRRAAPAGVEVLLKDEARNPTGSFKARGLSLAVNRARELGARGVRLASSGNAGVAAAAYAAAAGLRARVALPATAPPAIVQRCRAHGAEVLVTAGSTLLEAAAALCEGDDGLADLGTLREPYRVEGKKTMGLELAEQLGWRAPDWIVYPTGGGTGVIGMHKAFAELAGLGLLAGHGPRFAIVQMAGCAPLVRAWRAGEATAEPWAGPATRVWGLLVPRALGDFLVLRAVRESGGAAVAVAEHRPVEVAARLAREEGLEVGAEGAAAIAGLEALCADGTIRRGERVVVFQTGHPAAYG